MQRYKDYLEYIAQPNGKRRYETMYYPKFEHKTSDVYIIAKKLERMDLLAFEYYNDSRLWWIIRIVNNLPGGTFQIPAGTRIRIPYPLDQVALHE